MRRHGQAKVECTNNDALHAQDLSARVRLIGDVDEVAHLGWVDLFVLRDHEESRDSDELHLLLADLVQAAVPVDDVHGEEERLRPQLEVVVDLNQPVHECRPDRLIDFLLL